jgi:uncharacterized protein (DUF58 family)
VLDPAERTFTFEDATPAVFRDLESGQRLFIDPPAARDSYQRALVAHQEALAAACRRFGVTHHVLSTAEALDLALLAFLGGRRAGRAA